MFGLVERVAECTNAILLKSSAVCGVEAEWLRSHAYVHAYTYTYTHTHTQTHTCTRTFDTY